MIARLVYRLIAWLVRREPVGAVPEAALSDPGSGSEPEPATAEPDRDVPTCILHGLDDDEIRQCMVSILAQRNPAFCARAGCLAKTFMIRSER